MKKIHFAQKGNTLCYTYRSKRWSSMEITSTKNIEKVTCKLCRTIYKYNKDNQNDIAIRRIS